MGDVAMTVPVIRAFVQQHPTVKITFLSKPFLKPLFENIDNVSFYAAQVKGPHKGLFGLYKLFKELKARNITEVADLHNVIRSKFLRSLFRISGVRVSYIDKGRVEKRALTRIKNKIFEQLKTTHQRYVEVFDNLGFKVDISNPEFPTPDPLSEKIKNITGTKKEAWIGIAPFAQYQSKMYPLDLMEQVIGELSKAKTIKIILFGGGKKETEILAQFSNRYPNTINAAGTLNLGKELQLIAHLDCMLSMDSGNAHFAAMQGINTITIWGATHPFTGFAPFNQPIENAILPDLKKFPHIPSSIYGNKVIPGYEEIMRSIAPKKVVDKIIDSL
jgi:ADP-heptose:LPS heptosyltransferase